MPRSGVDRHSSDSIGVQTDSSGGADGLGRRYRQSRVRTVGSSGATDAGARTTNGSNRTAESETEKRDPDLVANQARTISSCRRPAHRRRSYRREKCFSERKADTAGGSGTGTNDSGGAPTVAH